MPGTHSTTVEPKPGDALIVVDLQRDFLPDGALPVANGDAVIPIANELARRFEARQLPIFASRDWHPADHCSFEAQGGSWPPHCVQQSPGAQLADGLLLPHSTRLVSKGANSNQEAYSAFARTDFEQLLRERQVRRLFVCGVATEYCVLETVKDAVSRGFEVVLLADGVRAVNRGQGRQAIRQMLGLGTQLSAISTPASPNAETSVLLTDLYQLTMLQTYYDCDMHQEAVFEFFVRKLPQHRNFLVAAGLEQALDFLEQLRFSDAELNWLDACGRFRPEFVDYLANLRFTGAVHAMPEGTVFFPNEPILRVTAPMPEAQLVESRLINILQFQTVIASKAVRSVLAAPGKLLVDFGMRRAHGAEAAMFAARSSYLAGFAGSATVLAGMRYGVPLYGTMAHSLIQAHDNEVEAFERFAAANPDNVVLLLDTYDTEAAAEKLVEVAAELKARDIPIRGVRLDSGDLAEHARRVRRILDRGGLSDVTIFASGNLDEDKLRAFIDSGAPIDGFGIGSRLDVSADAPYMDCAYKLQEYAGHPRRKRSEGKATWPGRKQVFRTYDNGMMSGDVITLDDDSQPGEPLIEPVMQGGRRLGPRITLSDLRQRLADNLAKVPRPLRSLDPAPDYRVEVSQALRGLAEELDRPTSSRQS